MKSGGWTGRWSIGCAGMFAGALFFASLFVMLFVGDTIGEAVTSSGVVAAIGLAGSVLFGLLGYRNLRRRRRTLAAVRDRLEARGAVSDDRACGSIPVNARPFFLQVRGAVAEFLECPPEWLQASDELEADYQSADFGWVELEWHVFERIRKSLGYESIEEDLIQDTAVKGTLADLASHLQQIFDSLEPPPTDAPEPSQTTTSPAS